MAALVSSGSNAGLEINFTANIEEVRQHLRDVDKWAIPYITAAALTDTAIGARKAEKRAMPWYLDRPTSYVTRGVLWEKATKNYLVSRVYINDDPVGGTPQSRILEPNVEGGPRRAKPYERRLRRAGILGPNEYTVPGTGARLDVYGNLGSGNIERMLSQLQAAEQFAGYQANETKRSRRRKRGRAKSRYFVARGDSKLARGIWERYSGCHGRQRIRPFLIFVQGAPNYRVRYPFGETARQHAERNFARHWKRRFDSFVVKGKILKGSI